jgi:hypothetical protein
MGEPVRIWRRAVASGSTGSSLRYTWRYRIDVLPRREARIAASGVPAIDFHSPREAAAWLAAGAPLEGLGAPRSARS